MLKQIPGYKDCYFVSTKGEIYSTYYGGMKKLSPFKDSCGYLCIKVFKNGKTTTLSVHRAVCLAFLPNPEKKPQVNHKNGIKTDNRLENLEWCTAYENIHHAIRTGLINNIGNKYGCGPDGKRLINNAPRGERHAFAKLSDSDVLNIRKRISNGEKVKDLAKEYSVHFTTIYNAVKGATWSHIK